MENRNERGKGVPVLVRAMRILFKVPQSEQSPVETGLSPQVVEPLAPTIDQQMGEYLNKRTEHFTAVQKKSLVLAVLLLMASSFVFLFSRGLTSSKKVEMEQSMPALKSDTISTTSKLRLTP